MSTDTALIEKREELKRRLATGEYKTPVDVFLAWLDRLIGKIIRRSEPLPIWLVTTILTIALAVFSFAMLYASGDLTNYRETAEHNRLGYEFGILFHILGFPLPIISAIVFNKYVGNILVFWRENVLDIFETKADLEDFQDWLNRVCNRRLILLFLLIFGTYSFIYVMFFVPKNGYGSAFAFTIAACFLFALLYLFFMTIVLSARLRRYDLKLFVADPGNSQIIPRLSSQLNFVVYFVAIFAAIETSIFSTFGEVFRTINMNLIFLMWLPLTIMFILNQTSLASIIRRAKWKTINQIQARVEKLQAAEILEKKETIEAINRLMDYHDRVRATRTSAIDLGTILNFINSLLLPLLAFVLGNLDLVLNFFARKP